MMDWVIMLTLPIYLSKFYTSNKSHFQSNLILIFVLNCLLTGVYYGLQTWFRSRLIYSICFRGEGSIRRERQVLVCCIQRRCHFVTFSEDRLLSCDDLLSCTVAHEKPIKHWKYVINKLLLLKNSCQIWHNAYVRIILSDFVRFGCIFCMVFFRRRVRIAGGRFSCAACNSVNRACSTSTLLFLKVCNSRTQWL